MNNLMFLLILFSLLLVGCGNNQSSNLDSQNLEAKEKQKKEVNLKSGLANVVFVADTTINNKLILDDYQSIEKYFENKSNFQLVERLRSSPVAIFSNKGQKEYLLAYQYEGSSKNAFACFEIGNLNELHNVLSSEITQTEIENFNTESGLGLRQSIEDVKKIKGKAFIEAVEGNEKIISYKIDDAKSDFLGRYNMPSYFLKITFDKSEKVKKIIFGFDYP